MLQLNYSYSTVWTQELIDSSNFHNLVPESNQNLPKKLINPEDFGGLNSHEEFILDQFKVGGFIFDSKFISENLITEGNIEQIRNLNLYK
jgi:hypothetical protein